MSKLSGNGGNPSNNVGWKVVVKQRKMGGKLLNSTLETNSIVKLYSCQPLGLNKHATNNELRKMVRNQ